MISANGGLPAHRYTPQVTQRWPRGSEPASVYLGCATLLDKHPANGDLGREIVFLAGLLTLPMGVTPHLESLTSRLLLLVTQSDAGEPEQP